MPNLIPIPSNAFSGAAVKWDNAPVDRALLQNTWAKQQASQLALDKYFDKQSNQLTGTGMDMQNDGEDFIKLKNAWQEHALANRRAIVNPSLDGGKAATESNAMYNEARQFAQKSIQKVKSSQGIYKILSDPAKSALLTDAARDKLHHGTLGLNDPEYVPLDPNDVAFNPKPWSTADEAGLSNEVAKYKGTSKDREPVVNQDKGTQVVTTDTTFSPEDLTGMYGAAHSRYYSNPSFKMMIDDIPKKDPILFNNLNSLFKQHYGRDVQTGEDLSAAYGISKNPNARSVDKTVNIPPYSPTAIKAKTDLARIQAGISLAKSKDLADYTDSIKEKHKDEKAVPDTETMVKDLEDYAVKKKAQPFDFKGTPQVGYSVPLTPEIKSIFKTKSGSHDVEVDDVKYDPKAQTYTGIYFKKEDGKPVLSPSGTAANSESIPPVQVPRTAVKDAYDKSHLSKGTAPTPAAAAPPKATGKKEVKVEDIYKKYGITPP